jgi:alpha-1,2-mannosyltransferase
MRFDGSTGLALPSTFFADRPAWWAVPLVAAAVVFSFWGTIGKPDCMDEDFGSYYRAARAVAAGQSPYLLDEHGWLGAYPYAPVFPYLLIPLGQLDYLWACRLWLLLNWLTLAACCGLVLRLAGSSWAGPHWQWLMLGLIPTAAYIWATLRVGQVSLLMFLGCLAWADFRRRGWRFAGGFCLAPACALKLAPGVFIPYMLLRRDFRGLAGVAAASAALALAPAAWVGLDGVVPLHRQWIQHTSQTQVPEQTFRPGNQSLLAQLARLPAISSGHELYSKENLDRLCAWYPVLVAGLLGLLLVGLAWRKLDPSLGGETLEVALLLVFLTLAHPRGWRCNYAAMLLPCTILASIVYERQPRWQWALCALAAMTVACAWPTDGVGEDGWSLWSWLLLGKHFWGAMAVGAACWWTRPRLSNLTG